MKKFLFLAIAIFSLAAQAQTTDKLTVMAWNVWHGGHSKEYPGKGCEGAMGIFKASKADVILMVETYGSSSDVARGLGFHHTLISDNLSIYSRYPIVEKYTFADTISTFNFGGVAIDVNGKKVRLFATWLHYLPDMRLAPTSKSESEIIAWEESGTRVKEVNAILTAIAPMMSESDKIPIIMGGDFNTHSHLDWTSATKNMYNHNGAVVAWPVSRAMQAAGFVDSFRELNPKPEVNVGVTWLDGAEPRFDRIDYIYYKGAIKAVDSNCYDNSLGKSFNFKGREFFYPSDHGFVLTTFTF